MSNQMCCIRDVQRASGVTVNLGFLGKAVLHIHVVILEDIGDQKSQLKTKITVCMLTL